MMRGTIALLLPALLVLLTAAACGSEPAATPTAGPTPTPASERIAALKAESAAKGLRFLTHDEIVEGAMREGRLIAQPSLDDSNFPGMKASFEATYPFIELEILTVGGTDAGERFDMSLISGVAEVDIITAGADDYQRYAEYQLLLPFDYRAMAEAGELAINPDAIIDTPMGQTPFFNTAIRLIVYNTDMVPPEDAVDLGWETCLDPKWRGLVATDTRTDLNALLGAWSEEELLEFARRFKANDPIFVRGATTAIVRLLAGEFAIYCVTNFHSALRLTIADPRAPLGFAPTDPLIVDLAETEGIYAGADHPHAALLWMEWLSRRDVQLDVIGKTDPGKPLYLIEGTASYELLKDFKGTVHLCIDECLLRSAEISHKIVVDAFGFPRVGAPP